MQRGLNLQSGLQLTQDTGRCSEGPLGIAPEELVLSAVPFAFSHGAQLYLLQCSAHQGCRKTVQSECWGLSTPRLSFSGVLHVRMTSSRPPFTPRVAGGMFLQHRGSRVFPQWLFTAIFSGNGSTDGPLRVNRAELGVNDCICSFHKEYQPGLAKSQRLQKHWVSVKPFILRVFRGKEHH